MALLFLGCGVRCAVSPLTRTGPGTPIPLLVSVGLACVVLALGVFLVGHRFPRPFTPALLAVVIAVTSLLVATSASRTDALLAAFAFPWAGLYAAHFMSRRAAHAFGALASVGCAVGIAVSGLPSLLGAWVMVTATIAVVILVTTSLVEALRAQSETDWLTGVSNRAGFSRLSSQALASAERRGQPTALILCDVDGLKQVNDSQGHAAGDALLADIVAAWRPVLRGGDVLGRIGGDEFALLMSDTDRAGAEAAVRRLQQATSTAFSAGVAVSASSEHGIEDLLARADAAMYVHKEANRRTAMPLQRRPDLEVRTA